MWDAKPLLSYLISKRQTCLCFTSLLYKTACNSRPLIPERNDAESQRWVNANDLIKPGVMMDLQVQTGSKLFETDLRPYPTKRGESVSFCEVSNFTVKVICFN